MVVEVVESVEGLSRFQRVQRRLTVVLAVLTVGMIMLWPYRAAHRSVANFVVTLLWTLAVIALSSMMIVGPDEEPVDEDGSEGVL